MRTVVIVGFDRAQILDITGPAQVFASASELSPQPQYRVVLASLEGRHIATTAGLTLQATSLDEINLEDADTVLISGGHGAEEAATDPHLQAFVKKAAGSARRLGSVCTGAFILAAAGVAEGKRLATHWRWARRMQEIYPAVSVDADALYVQDGDLWSSAGVTAGIDMCLALVEADLGRDLAMKVARGLVVYARRPGSQSQFSTLLKGQVKSAGSCGAIINWMADNLAEPITVNDAAARASMSERSFHRHFVKETGDTPARYLERLRLDAARSLLEGPGLPLKAVAAHSGFGTAGRLIQAFERRFGMSPTAYRQLHGQG